MNSVTISTNAKLVMNSLTIYPFANFWSIKILLVSINFDRKILKKYWYYKWKINTLFQINNLKFAKYTSVKCISWQQNQVCEHYVKSTNLNPKVFHDHLKQQSLHIHLFLWKEMWSFHKQYLKQSWTLFFFLCRKLGEKGRVMKGEKEGQWECIKTCWSPCILYFTLLYCI